MHGSASRCLAVAPSLPSGSPGRTLFAPALARRPRFAERRPGLAERRPGPMKPAPSYIVASAPDCVAVLDRHLVGADAHAAAGEAGGHPLAERPVALGDAVLERLAPLAGQHL